MLRLLAAKVLAIALCSELAFARELRLPAVLSDHAVLQAHAPIEIWGWGSPGHQVNVTFGEHSISTRVNEFGRFSVEFPALSASYESRQLEVASSEGSLVRENILIGEVWLAGGQSNMVWELEDAVGGRDESVSADDQFLRLFEVRESASMALQNDVGGHWVRVRPRAARRFSAVGYFFGKNLRQRLDAPVGIVQVAYGGTRIEAWMPAEEIATDPAFEAANQQLEAVRAADLRQRLSWAQNVHADIARLQNETDPAGGLSVYAPPVWPGREIAKNTPSVLFNAMLGPMLRFPSRGMVWYQGESNRDDGVAYEGKLKRLVSILQRVQGENYPIGIVQIAPVAQEDGFQDIWHAQRVVAQSDERIGLIVTTDLAELQDIHPRRKREVGERLAIWALSTEYGVNAGLHSGPLIKSAEKDGDQFRLSFDYSDGLTTLDGAPLSGFVLRTLSDRSLVADAEIDGRQIILKGAAAAEACLIEYHMRPDAFPTLTNSSGIPASPFRVSVRDCGFRD